MYGKTSLALTALANGKPLANGIKKTSSIAVHYSIISPYILMICIHTFTGMDVPECGSFMKLKEFCYDALHDTTINSCCLMAK